MLHMNDVSFLLPAVLFLRENSLARAAFEVVTKNLGISGYGVAREPNRNPELVKAAISSLVDFRLISGSASLTDNLAPTGLGFGVKEAMSAHPEWWQEMVPA